jgi:hypothetical protein
MDFYELWIIYNFGARLELKMVDKYYIRKNNVGFHGLNK